MIDAAPAGEMSVADWYQTGWEHAEWGILKGWPPQRYNPRINVAFALGRNSCLDAYGVE